MGRLAALPGRQASFREEKRLAALDQPLVSQGLLVWQRPDHLEKITAAPEAERLIVDGGYLALIEGEEPPRSLPLDSQPDLAALVEALRGLLAGDLDLIERHYRVEAVGGPASWRLVLRPVSPGVQRLLRDVAVEGRDADIRTIRIALANGDEQTMTIGPSS